MASTSKLIKVAQATKHVKHLISANTNEAKGKSRDLYKAWYRQMESIRKYMLIIDKVV